MCVCVRESVFQHVQDISDAADPISEARWIKNNDRPAEEGTCRYSSVVDVSRLLLELRAHLSAGDKVWPLLPFSCSFTAFFYS